ncbi:DUF6221 family protein [Streptomyces sp. GQFP]|uniref:DUF6221 family protein n=1 Tax=Streptomyces sp. GQFP TaxID=2907545 RepID=UPI001F27F9B4|nr:DUF6221 family protein [Streptomyces sp. GQFP]UIX34221.1 DUF6221 family protein [Streptomyces sp. GQFP]
MDTVTDLASFVHDRLDEEERDAALFHELDCPNSHRTGRISCSCPCPDRILDRAATRRDLLRRCEQRIRREAEGDLRWSRDSILAFQTMKALALPFELHPTWRDNWYP